MEKPTPEDGEKPELLHPQVEEWLRRIFWFLYMEWRNATKKEGTIFCIFEGRPLIPLTRFFSNFF